MSGRSSSSDPQVPDPPGDLCTFLDDTTLKFQHFGPRAIMLGDFASTFRPKVPRNRSGVTVKSIDFSTQSLSLSNSSIPALNNSGLSQRQPPKRRVVRATRQSRTKSVASKFGFSQEDEEVYDEFARLLSNFEPEEMFDIIADVMKVAKKTAAG